jgi:subtilisin family serine protease
MKIKSTIFLSMFFVINAVAQKPNWHNLDLQKDSVFGISTEKAYSELQLSKKKFSTVIVGVIDSGLDTAHEDLKPVIWTNTNEIPGNGIDDDHDGYVDDVHGWDFIGGPKGDVNQENLELTRLIKKGNATPQMLQAYQKLLNKDNQIVDNIKGFEFYLDSMIIHMQKPTPTLADFQAYKPRNGQEEQVKKIMIDALGENPDYATFRKSELDDVIKHYEDDLNYALNLSFNPRTIVGDDTTNAEEHFYGNNDVAGPADLHGTHVAGIIGAVRNNNIGIDGIADHVQIMSVRTVPDGDERDKDVANAIRYATDNGAKVFNMSFGKAYSPDKKVVDEAVKYAMSKDVLIVHAAGNESENLDKEKNYPNRIYKDSSGSAGAWIEVGASGWKNDETLVASFSNYGKTTVDVFAPGVQIHSTLPNSTYGDESGTSMASPVVAGLAALIREYYPKLTALQVKEIIMKSVVKPTQLVKVKDGEIENTVLFSEVCISGGIVNTYNALKLAATYK